MVAKSSVGSTTVAPTAAWRGHGAMNPQEPPDELAATLLDFDQRAHDLFGPLAGTPLVRMLDLVSKLGDQPELRTIAGSLMVAGTLGGSDRLVRAGARMMIAH